jgi:hypothetical protein
MWDSNINMDLRKVGWRGMGWIDDSGGQVSGSYEYGNEPSDHIKCGEFLD